MLVAAADERSDGRQNLEVYTFYNVNCVINVEGILFSAHISECLTGLADHPCKSGATKTAVTITHNILVSK